VTSINTQKKYGKRGNNHDKKFEPEFNNKPIEYYYKGKTIRKKSSQITRKKKK
jgi:hypothetical protein